MKIGNPRPRRLLFSVTLKDCRVETFRSGGPGGQYQNKTESGVRVVHPPSGAVGESREHRTQHLNKREAFVRMAKSPRYQAWAKAKAARMLGEKSTEQKVDEAMTEHNIKTEVRDQEGKWAPAAPETLTDE